MSESTAGGFRRAVLVSEPKQAEPRSLCCQRNRDTAYVSVSLPRAEESVSRLCMRRQEHTIFRFLA